MIRACASHDGVALVTAISNGVALWARPAAANTVFKVNGVFNNSVVGILEQGGGVNVITLNQVNTNGIGIALQGPGNDTVTHNAVYFSADDGIVGNSMTGGLIRLNTVILNHG